MKKYFESPKQYQEPENNNIILIAMCIFIIIIVAYGTITILQQ